MKGGKAAEGMEMIVRGKQDVYAIFLRISVTLAISVAGFMTARRRSRPRRYSSSPPASRFRFASFSGAKSQTIGELALGLKEDLRILKGDEPPAKIVNDTSTATTIVGLTPRSRSSDNHEGFLLSELNDLEIKEIRENGKNLEIITTSSMPKESEVKDDSIMEQEIVNLRTLVWSLQEKERSLELQLLEYYGMQEQEAAMRELESPSKMNSTETKFYSFKIESLQADNQRLLASLSECSRAMNELEAAKVTIKFLKKKLRLDGEQAKAKIAFLQQRLGALQSEELKEEKENDEIERKLQKLKELEDETAELKRINSRLAEENSDLARKLESVQVSECFALEGEEADALTEAKILKESNDKLMTDIEQLKTDRCADVEELVYLKWVNACLRYEMRNYQAPPGKTIARDLSKQMSPRSEERAKQLIVEYSNSGGDEKSVSSVDFDYEYSPSQSSTAEPEDSPVDISCRRQNKNKRKFLSKLKKLVLGKESSSSKALTADKIPRNPTSSSSSRRRVSKSISSIDDMARRDSFSSLSSSLTEDLNASNRSARMDAQADEACQSEDSWSQGYSRSSSNAHNQQGIDFEEARKEKDENYKRQDAASGRYGRMVSGEDNAGDLGGGFDTPEKAELKKYAFALMNTGGAAASQFKRRSASFDRFDRGDQFINLHS